MGDDLLVEGGPTPTEASSVTTIASPARRASWPRAGEYPNSSRADDGPKPLLAYSVSVEVQNAY